MKQVCFLLCAFTAGINGYAQCKPINIAFLQKLIRAGVPERIAILQSEGFAYHSTYVDKTGLSAVYTACYKTYNDGYATFEQSMSVQSDAAVTFHTLSEENFRAIYTLLQKTTKYEGYSDSYGYKFKDGTYTYSLLKAVAAYGVEKNHPKYIVAIIIE